MSTLSEPRFIDSPALHLVGMDRAYTFETRTEIPQLWHEFGPRFGSIPGQKGFIAYGVCHHFDDKGFNYMAAAEVEEGVGAPEGMTTMHLPAQRYAAFKHQGDLSNLSDSYMALWDKWVPESGQEIVQPALIFERYSEDFAPDSGKGDIELWIAVK